MRMPFAAPITWWISVPARASMAAPLSPRAPPRSSLPIPMRRRNAGVPQIEIQGAHGNNLEDLTVSIPVGLLTCVTGVSGSGKSTLINDTLFRFAAARLNDGLVEGAAAA